MSDQRDTGLTDTDLSGQNDMDPTGGTDTDLSGANDADRSVLTGFDQTNGVVDGLEGESDGSAESEEYSRGERTGYDTVLDTEGEGVGDSHEHTGD